MNDSEKIRIRVQIGITIVLGGFSLAMLALKPDESQLQKWAFGTIGILIGYWLK